MNTSLTTEADETLVNPLSTIERTPLGRISAGQAARVKRRIVEHESNRPRLDIAAFNSAS